MKTTSNYHSTAEAQTPHFFIIPSLAPGHLIPTTDIARLLSEHNASVTILTTPVNASRIKPTIDRFNAASAGSTILICFISAGFWVLGGIAGSGRHLYGQCESTKVVILLIAVPACST
jgi:hypothetical protein